MSTTIAPSTPSAGDPDGSGRPRTDPERLTVSLRRKGGTSAREPKAPKPPRDKALPPGGATRSAYRPDIDGIRGAAAIMVMGFHAKVPGFEGAYIGLDLFFVVSGFVITGLLMHEFNRTGGIKWGAFYARRARRLIPAKATMLIGVLVLSFFVMTPTGSQQETAQSAAAAAVFVSNFFFWQSADVDYFGHEPGTGVLLHTWSLSVEEQFYLALPLLLLIAWAVSKLLRMPIMRTLILTTLALGVASAWLAIAWADPYPDAAYYLPITRAFEFLIGVGLALVVPKLTVPAAVRAVMGVVGALLCAYCIWQPLPVEGYPSYWALIPCAGAMLMVWAGVGGPTVVSRLLSLRFLVGLGLVSYGWYLWHWPLLVFGESVNLAPPPLWMRVALIMVGLGLAYLSYRFVEGIFYKRAGSNGSTSTWGNRRVMMSGVTAMTMVATLAGAAYVVADDQAESPRWEGVVQQLNDVPEMPEECLGDEEFIPAEPYECHLNDYDEDRPTIVLWGDSHAWMYIPALEAAARNRDVNLVAFVMGGCPPLDPPDELRIACSRNNKLAMSFVRKARRSDQPLRVVLGASWETYRGGPVVSLMQERAGDTQQQDYVDRIAGLFRSGAPRLFFQLGRLGVDVDVIGPSAVIGRNAPLCEARDRPFSCDLPRSRAIADESETNDYLRRQMLQITGSSRLIDTARALCDEDTCYAETDGVLNYFDDNHLSASFAERLGKYFGPTVRAVT